jgi:hypothetical protein
MGKIQVGGTESLQSKLKILAWFLWRLGSSFFLEQPPVAKLEKNVQRQDTEHRQQNKASEQVIDGDRSIDETFNKNPN